MWKSRDLGPPIRQCDSKMAVCGSMSRTRKLLLFMGNSDLKNAKKSMLSSLQIMMLLEIGLLKF
jgi:hypothetical protein